MFTRFMDMHSGGGLKEDPLQYIYIEAEEAEAVVIFYNRFGHNPNRVTCTCCGEDYSIDSAETLELASAYDRQCKSNYPSGPGYDLETAQITVEDYVKQEDILVIYAADIKDEERQGSVPQQGYVWMD